MIIVDDGGEAGVGVVEGEGLEHADTITPSIAATAAGGKEAAE